MVRSAGAIWDCHWYLKGGRLVRLGPYAVWSALTSGSVITELNHRTPGGSHREPENCLVWKNPCIWCQRIVIKPEKTELFWYYKDSTLYLAFDNFCQIAFSKSSDFTQNLWILTLGSKTNQTKKL